nr:protein NETWORKED 2A-like [Arachis hypogaea]
MLQRAATNAYTWWWASHVRTKQSKWLEQSLQDVEDKAAEALQIIDHTGDSFAQRAEMYYKKKPELLNFVEETLKAYRSLAQRFDHISKELQTANRQLATVFPEQVQYRMDDDDEFDVTFPASNASSQETQKSDISKAASVRKQNLRSYSMLLSRKGPSRKIAGGFEIPICGFSKAEAHAQVDKLQKEILALQTEKEFVRSLYEGSYDKYWEIEDRIVGIQKIVGDLQDEFGISTVIEDNDARTLMATTALNSCKVKLTKLQEEQLQSSEEANAAFQKVKESHERIETLKEEFLSKHSIQLDQGTETDLSSIDIEEELAALEDEPHEDAELLKENMENLEEDSDMSHTMTEIVELIDKLVNKVVFLETAVSSQNVSVKRLMSEAEKLETNIKSLEEDKEMLLDDSEKTKKLLKELEEEMKRVKLLNRNVRMQENSIQSNFTEASYNLENLSEKLKDVKPEEHYTPYKKRSGDNLAIMKDVETTKEEKEDYPTDLSNMTGEDNKKEDYATDLSNSTCEDNKSKSEENTDPLTESIPEVIEQEKDDLPQTVDSVDIKTPESVAGEEEDQPNIRQIFVSGLDDREKILLEEYTSVLKDYKLVKVKLHEMEKKNSESINELELQVSSNQSKSFTILNEFKKVISMKDEEINILQQKLNSSEENPAEEALLENETQEASMQEQDEIPSSAMEESARSSSTDQPEIPSPGMEEESARSSFADQPQDAENKEDLSTSMSPTTESILQQIVAANHIEDHHSPLSAMEKKFRSYIDDLMEENLEFWLRFSTAVHQIQRFQTCIQDLKLEVRNIKFKKRTEGELPNSNIQSEIKPIYRHLREIRTELSLWLEHNAVLQEELQTRHPTLISLQDEIARAANPVSTTERAQLSEYQAAKFQGEVLHMKQESNRILSELQGGLSFVKGLKVEVEKSLEEMGQELGVNKPGQVPGHVHMKQNQPSSRTRIPLRSFLFGVKLKKHGQSSSSSRVNAAMQKPNLDPSTTHDATL